MKNTLFVALSVALVFCLNASATITTVTSGSGTAFGTLTGDANQCNSGLTTSIPAVACSGTNNTYNIAPNGAWAAAPAGSNWVSLIDHEDLGSGANGEWVDFYQTFTILDPTIVSASLSIFADDRADVSVNGTTLFTTPQVNNSTCNSQIIGCIPQYGGVVDIASAVKSGVNTLTIRVYQDAGSGFGTAYAATITSTPEPGFIGVLSLGLSGVLLALRRKREKSAV